MKREIVRGRSTKEVQSKIDRAKTKGWYPVSDIKEDPTYYELVYVCVIQHDTKIPNTGKTWGNRFHLD